MAMHLCSDILQLRLECSASVIQILFRARIYVNFLKLLVLQVFYR